MLGTDHLGRDLAARLAAAMRGSLAMAGLAALISGAAGGVIGLASGYAGGWVDMAVQRATDGVMALPLIVLALAVVAATGPSKTGIVAALSVAFIPLTARVARASALTLRTAAYVDAARATGATGRHTVMKHVIPGAAGPWAVVVAAQAGGALLAEASLSFLGLAPAGTLSLGGMLGREAQVYMHSSPWIIVWPGLALVLATLSANLIGEGLADLSGWRSLRRVSQPAAGA
jgi:peptide/nickel transport system permease protein